MTKKEKPYDAAALRKDLHKVLPGYKWAVHRSHKYLSTNHIEATGTVSGGFNRVSTLTVKVAIRPPPYKGPDFNITMIDPHRCTTVSGWGETFTQCVRDLQNSLEDTFQRTKGNLEILRQARKAVALQTTEDECHAE